MGASIAAGCETTGVLKAERRDVLEALRDLKVALATTNYDGLNRRSNGSTFCYLDGRRESRARSAW